MYLFELEGPSEEQVDDDYFMSLDLQIQISFFTILQFS